MSNEIRNESGHLPKEKKEPSLGQRLPLKLFAFNSFALRFEGWPLTTVSSSKGYSQMLSNEQNVQECDTTDDDSSTTAWTIKIFLN
jgi:hypothetical protein